MEYNYSLSRCNLGNCQTIFDVPPNSCFDKDYHCVRFIAKASQLAKRSESGFQMTKMRNKDLQYHFTGKESHLFCHNFTSIIASLKTDADQTCHTFKLHVFAYTAMNLRDSVSLFSRVTLSSDQVQSLGQVCSNFFKATALFLSCTLPPGWLAL